MLFNENISLRNVGPSVLELIEPVLTKVINMYYMHFSLSVMLQSQWAFW